MKQIKVFTLVRVWLIIGALLWPLAVRAQTSSPHAVLMSLEGPLTPAMLTYLERVVTQAENSNAPLIVLKLNTPGGSIDLMEKIVSVIRNSAVPVVVYVAPRGAIAGSAGTLITLAGHVAAMAPETAIGAASPVGGEGEDLDETLEAKIKQATMALARTLAERRGPAAVKLAEETIDKARAVTANEAQAAGLIDIIASDLPDLVRQLDERVVLVHGVPRTLLTSGLLVDELPMTFIEQVLDLLTDPNIVFLLLSLGNLLIIIELRTPGGWVTGLVGVGCLLLAFYGIGTLPVNWFGLIFIVLAFGLFVAEIATPTTFGALTLAGAVALIIGALVLFNSAAPAFYQVSVPLVVITSVLIAALSLVVLVFALRSLRRPVITGAQVLIGQTGEMRTGESAQVGSELWTVEPESGSLTVGDKVEVLAVKGLRLRVRKR
ncbi:MAG: nodulation protein NfeD [Anaerolineales bacterium]|nr:nodulation protein NfeD [Anaerolineales bacterium]